MTGSNPTTEAKGPQTAAQSKGIVYTTTGDKYNITKTEFKVKDYFGATTDIHGNNVGDDPIYIDSNRFLYFWDKTNKNWTPLGLGVSSKNGKLNSKLSAKFSAAQGKD